MTKFIREEGRQGDLTLYITDKGNGVLVPRDLYPQLRGYDFFEYKIRAKKVGEFHLLTAINDKTLREEFREIPEKYHVLDRAHRTWLAQDNAWRKTPERERFLDLKRKLQDLERELRNLKSRYSSEEGFYDRITGTRERIISHVPEKDVKKFQDLRASIEVLKEQTEKALEECGPEPDPIPSELYLTDQEWHCIETVTGMTRGYNDPDEMLSKFMREVIS